MLAQVARHLVITGKVQGVGFRRTAKVIASRYPLSGYVRNLPGGEVELYIEGPGQILDNYIKELQAAMNAYIQKIESQDLTPVGIQSFEIRS